MNPAEFQPIARDAAQANVMRAQELLAVAMETPTVHPDLLLKVLNASAAIAQAVPEKKIDPNAGLATFNITFTGGRPQLTAREEPLVVVQEVQPARQPEALALPAPKKKRKSVAIKPLDKVDEAVVDMAAALELLLKVADD